MLKAEFACREGFSDLRGLQIKLSDYAHWHNNFRIRSMPGHVSPVEFRRAGPTPPSPGFPQVAGLEFRKAGPTLSKPSN